MLTTDWLHILVNILLTVILMAAAVSDIKSRRIPNPLVMSMLLLFVVWSAATGIKEMPGALLAGGIAFAVGVVMYSLGKLGAGDVKLFAALSLFAGMGHLLILALATAISGGVVALVQIALQPRRAAASLALGQKIQVTTGGVPYGVAIAIGGLFFLWGSKALNL